MPLAGGAVLRLGVAVRFPIAAADLSVALVLALLARVSVAATSVVLLLCEINLNLLLGQRLSRPAAVNTHCSGAARLEAVSKALYRSSTTGCMAGIEQCVVVPVRERDL